MDETHIPGILDNRHPLGRGSSDGNYLQLLISVVKARGESLSSFARRAVLTELGKLSFLPDDSKEALGLLGGIQ